MFMEFADEKHLFQGTPFVESPISMAETYGLLSSYFLRCKDATASFGAELAMGEETSTDAGFWPPDAPWWFSCELERHPFSKR